jgi:hypothetical protein
MAAIYGLLVVFPAIILTEPDVVPNALSNSASNALIIGAVSVFGVYIYRREFLETDKYEILFALTAIGLNIFQFLVAAPLALFFFILDSLSGGADSTEG